MKTEIKNVIEIIRYSLKSWIIIRYRDCFGNEINLNINPKCIQSMEWKTHPQNATIKMVNGDIYQIDAPYCIERMKDYLINPIIR